MMNIDSPDAFRRLVDIGARMGMPQLPVATWAQTGSGCALIINGAATAWPKALMKKFRGRPTLVILGADQGQDDDPQPAEWVCLPGLVEWASRASILLHAAGGQPEHYRLACREAERRGKVLIVECTPRTLTAWADALPKGAVLSIVPKDGAHPVGGEVAH